VYGGTPPPYPGWPDRPPAEAVSCSAIEPTA
ncbi:recombinase RecB, partial [Mycobacterium ulcerans]